MSFWINEPTVLFNKNEVTQIWFNPYMTFEKKMNAISRLVMLLTLIGFAITGEVKFLIIGLITLASIVCIYLVRQNQVEPYTKEGFDNPVSFDSIDKPNFSKPTKYNPMSNVLLTDIVDNPDKNQAPPSFNEIISDEIDDATKKAVQMLNPGIDNTTKQLYGNDIIENINFDNSMRAFYSTPNSRVTNDQTAFAKYLYGDMPSCKTGDAFACVQDNLRYVQM